MKPLERMQLSLTGLSSQIRLVYPFDDTEMALSIVETLWRYGQIEPDALAEGFSRRYNPRRGYGAGAHRHDFLCDRASARACFLAFPVRFRSP
jgi:hypothetical protein